MARLWGRDFTETRTLVSAGQDNLPSSPISVSLGQFNQKAVSSVMMRN